MDNGLQTPKENAVEILVAVEEKTKQEHLYFDQFSSSVF